MDHHPHDEKWISEQMSLIKPEWRPKAKKLYIEKFIFTFNQNDGKINQVNLSRRSANTLLLDIVSKCKNKQRLK